MKASTVFAWGFHKETRIMRCVQYISKKLVVFTISRIVQYFTSLRFPFFPPSPDKEHQSFKGDSLTKTNFDELYFCNLLFLVFMEDPYFAHKRGYFKKAKKEECLTDFLVTGLVFSRMDHTKHCLDFVSKYPYPHWDWDSWRVWSTDQPAAMHMY